MTTELQTLTIEQLAHVAGGFVPQPSLWDGAIDRVPTTTPPQKLPLDRVPQPGDISY